MIDNRTVLCQKKNTKRKRLKILEVFHIKRLQPIINKMYLILVASMFKCLWTNIAYEHTFISNSVLLTAYMIHWLSLDFYFLYLNMSNDGRKHSEHYTHFQQISFTNLDLTSNKISRESHPKVSQKFIVCFHFIKHV